MPVSPYLSTFHSLPRGSDGVVCRADRFEAYFLVSEEKEERTVAALQSPAGSQQRFGLSSLLSALLTARLTARLVPCTRGSVFSITSSGDSNGKGSGVLVVTLLYG